MKIGIFDSGVGGLFVQKKIMEKYPNNEFIYFGDTINLPYGDKTKNELKNFADKIIKFLISKGADIIIIACGTISSNIYEEIKNNYDIKLYDIISPSIDYLNKGKYNNIGITGTPRTIESKFFENSLKHKTYSIACSSFVDIIENNKLKEINSEIEKYLKEFKNRKIDALVFGCTHYPYLKNEIKNYLDYDYEEVDMGEKLLDILDLKEGNKSLELYFSKVTETLKRNVNKILDGNYKIIEKKL